jgi:hypothetical protein
MKRFLFIGTSHLIAFKSAWQSLSLNTNHEALFVGMSGPQLVYSLKLGWIEKINLILPHEDIKYYIEFMSAQPFESAHKVDEIPINFVPDVIIFLDMQFWYQVVERIKIDEQNILLFDEVPISDSCFSEMKIEGVGYRGLSNHHRFGNIPQQSVYPLISCFRKKYPSALMQCYAAPLAPEFNIQTRCMVIKKSSLDLLENIFTHLLSKYDCNFIPQDRETITSLQATKNEYSIGSRNGRSLLDRHCTPDFGRIHLINMLRGLGLCN